MPVTIDGTTGITSPDVSATTLTLPAGSNVQRMLLSTAQNTTSGTAIDFTGIPSWAKKITVMLNGVSTNGTSIVQIQIGAGSVQTSGYTGSTTGLGIGVATNNYTSGLVLFTNNEAAAASRVGHAVLTLVSGNIWAMSHSISLTNIATTSSGSSVVTLSGTLDRVRLTTVNGTDAFDAGSVNILIEGY